MQPLEPQNNAEIETIPGGMVVPDAARCRGARRVLVVNAKGGCGKTTIATNLASYYASRKQSAALLDYDPQGSSMQWLASRADNRFHIHGVAAFRKPTSGMTRSWQMRLPAETERLILDAPAGIHGMPLIDLVRESDTVIVPVLPSPIDIHAASHFIKDLLLVAKVRSRSIRVGVVANRVRKKTRVYQSLQRFLETLHIPFITYLRDTQNYVQSAEEGMGVHEWQGYNIRQDRQQWEKLIRWIEEVDEGESPQR